MHITKAPIAWDLLRGVVCLHKPADLALIQVENVLKVKLCRDLNQLEVRPPKDFIYLNESSSDKLTIQVKPSYADLPQVTGPRYMPDDIHLRNANHLGFFTSGILLMGINEGTKFAKKIQDAQWLRKYHVKGKFGETSLNFFKDGKIVDKSKYQFIKLHHLTRVLSSLEATHRNKMFEASGFSAQSQEVLELASQGPIRPTNKKLPIIYSIKCIEFNLPYFTLDSCKLYMFDSKTEIGWRCGKCKTSTKPNQRCSSFDNPPQLVLPMNKYHNACGPLLMLDSKYKIESINEKEVYLWSLIHEIGLMVRSSATCYGVKCIRFGPYSLEDGLLRNHWSLQNIINGINKVKRDFQNSEKSQLLNPPASLIDVSKPLQLESGKLY